MVIKKSIKPGIPTTTLRTDKSGKLQSQEILTDGMIKTNLNPIDTIKEQTGENVYKTGSGIQITGQQVETKIPGSAGLIKTEFNKTVDVPVYGSETNVTPKITTEQTKITSPTQVSQTDLEKGVSSGIYTKNQSGQYLDSKTGQVVTSTGTRTDVFDTNNDGVIQPEELTGEYKSFYDSLTDIEKKQFSSIGENARKQGQDVAKAIANYMRDYNTIKTRAEQDEANRLKLQGIVEEANVIQESQTLRKAQQSVDKLKQSVAYLGTGGVPGKSQTALNGVQNQIKEGNTTYQELVKLQGLAKSARAMGYESKALKYEQQMEDLNTKLNDDIDKTIQGAFNSLIEADNNGKLDTLEEIEAFRVKMLTDLDSSITGIADANIAQRQYLIERFDNIVKEEQTKAKNKGIVNKEMSIVQGFYVDGNGDPIISSTTGKRIEIPAEAPIDPVFDAKTGRLITFTTDANGQIQANVDQVIDSPTFEEQTIQNYAKLFANGKLDIGDLQNMGLGQELITDIISQSSGITPTPEEMTPYQKAQYDLDLKQFGLAVAKQNLEQAKFESENNLSGGAITTSKPTGNIVGITNNGQGQKNIKVDEIAQIPLINALNQIGINNYIVGSNQYRTPEQQAQLVKEGKSWTTDSKHMKGLAIDLYSGKKDGKLQAPTQQMIDIMAQNGWTRPAETVKKGDYGHFEYVGVSEQKQNALNTILGSGKFTKDQTKAITNAINSGEDPFIVIKNQAKQLLTGTNQTKIESYEQSRDSLKDLQTQLANFYRAGGDTGLFKGKYEQVVNKLGAVDDPKLVNLAVQIQSALQVYRNAVSGTAYSVQEGADIASIFPGITKGEGLNNAIINGRLKSMDSMIDNTYKSVLGNNYDKLKSHYSTIETKKSGTNNTVNYGGKTYNFKKQ